MAFIFDGQSYENEADIPDFGSIANTDEPDYSGHIRSYQGLSKDRDKLPKYKDLATGSNCLFQDTQTVVFYNASEKRWY